jgi:hypothetical protein
MVTKRRLLLGLAALLTVSAVFAIAILLVGHFGRTEARILGTTGVLAAYGVVALPGAILVEQGRAVRFAALLSVLAAAAAVLFLVLLWWANAPEDLGRAAGNATVLTLGVAQTAALVARRRNGDPVVVRRLFAGSTALALLVVTVFTLLIWGGGGPPVVGRLVGAAVVLDALAVALQPILARTGRDVPVHELVVTLAGGEVIALRIEAPDLATATAKAIRSLDGTRGVEEIRVGATAPPQTALSGRTSSSGV